MKKTVGVLSLQGCVKPHQAHIEAAGADFLEVKNAEDLKKVDALILPGGESGVLLKLLALFHLEKTLVQRAQEIPFWGICAGCILMAKKVSHPEQKSFGFVNIDVKRNAYGRQLESFEARLPFAKDQQVAFIRAPQVEAVGGSAQVKGLWQGLAVWVEEGRHMITTFHPELSVETPSYFHSYFIKKI